MITSPCIGVCEIDPKLQRCRGCWRTPEHLEKWIDYTESERVKIIDELEIQQWEAGFKSWSNM